MYKKSNIIASFNIAGYQFHDGPLVEKFLESGVKLKLKEESDNPHDENAVAVYYKKTMIGYVPAGENELISQLLHFGHGDILKAIVLEKNTLGNPWERITVRVNLNKNKG